MNKQELIFIFSFLAFVAFVGFDIQRGKNMNVEAKEVEDMGETMESPVEATEEAQIIVKSIKIVKPTPRPVTCEEAIKSVFEDPKPALKVSFCESTLGKYPTSNKSSAKGCFHIIDGTWKQFKCAGSPMDPLDNTKCAKKINDYYNGMWSTSGGWRASFACHKQI